MRPLDQPDLKDKYARVQRIARIGDWSWDVQTGEVVWSEEVFRIFGVDPQVPSYELARSLVHPEDRVFWESSVRAALEDGKPLDMAYRALRPDGTVCWIKNEAEVARDVNGVPLRVFGTAQDVTVMKRAEADLRATEAMLRAVIETSPNCIFVKDASGRYLLANPAIAKLYGTTPQEMVGRTDREFAARMRLAPEDAEAFVKDDFSVIRNGRSRFIPEERFTLPDGSVRWFQTTKAPIAFGDVTDCMLCIAVDITARKAAEKALRNSFLERTTLLDMLPSIVVLQDLDHRILWANREACASVGRLRESLIGRFCFEVWAERSVPCPDCPVAWSVQSGTQEVKEKTTPDGRHWRVHGRAVRNESGEITHALEVTEDITERKRDEERLEAMVAERTRALEEAQASLIRKEKLALLGQLAGGVGHELRNPLGAIKNAAFFLDMVLGEAEEEVRETLGILNREVGTAEQIIQSLFDAANPKTPTRVEEVDLNRTVRDELSRIPVPEAVRVTTDLREALSRLKGDPELLGQVVRNLVGNALQAMPEGGDLTVATEERPEGIEIRVEDTGTGIPKAILKKVFEPLFTTRAKGIGLGLALCRTHVEAHGGTIEVESEEGKGTCFTVRFPA